MLTWHIISPEYPPQIGGLGGYSSVLAPELARAGDEVHVWTAGKAPDEAGAGFCVHRSFGRFGLAGIWRTGRAWKKFAAPRRLLLQWVPQGFGCRGVNLPFCLWLWWRTAVRGDELEIMFHEVRVGWAGSVGQRLASLIQRLMVWVLTHAAGKLWMATLIWKPLLNSARKPAVWLPVPANVPGTASASHVSAARQRFAPGDALLIGHFGTGSPLHMPLLIEVARELLARNANARLLLIGEVSGEQRTFHAALPEAADRIFSTGPLPAGQVAAALEACDLVLQLYVDGVSTRRGSVMAALANGCPLVTTRGIATEPLWLETGALQLADAKNPAEIARVAAELMDNPAERARLRGAARHFYLQNFDVAITAARLRGVSQRDLMAMKA